MTYILHYTFSDLHNSFVINHNDSYFGLECRCSYMKMLIKKQRLKCVFFSLSLSLGFCLCCCRCAGKCGAYPQHFDKRRDACKRSLLGVILSVFVIAAMFGGKLRLFIFVFYIFQT